MSLEDRAREAYYAEMQRRVAEEDPAIQEPFTPWDDLKPWQRESWRCEVDPQRDATKIHRALLEGRDD